MIVINEDKILTALKDDLNKSKAEAFTSEIAYTLNEIRFVLRNIHKWCRTVKVRTPLINFPGKSGYFYQPYGTVLVISPWNYPFGLLFAPMVGAIAAGNCVIAKPSEMSSHSSALIYKLISETFEEEYIAVIEGGKEITQALINDKIDYVFFTGSNSTGRQILKLCAEHLIPVTLELGGKNPCIVDKETDLDVAAKRIVWGKFFNAGQTCVAPDYLLVDESISKIFLEKLTAAVNQFYFANHSFPDNFSRIIDINHFRRLHDLLNHGDILIGGNSDRDKLQIEPTIIINPDSDSALMKEEIFGPILPVLFYNKIDSVLSGLSSLPEPLCVYLFSKKKSLHKKVINQARSGSVCINGTINILMSGELPFGGYGASGFGRYHGNSGFLTFSRAKSVLKKSLVLDQSYLYNPHETDIKTIKKASKILY